MSEVVVKPEESSEDKISKKFDANFKKLVALFKSDKPLKGGKKIPKDEAAIVIDELLKERKEKAIAEFKVKASAAIDNIIKFNKEKVEAEKQFKKTIQDKKAESNKVMEDVFSIIEGLDVMEKEYWDAFKDGVKE